MNTNMWILAAVPALMTPHFLAPGTTGTQSNSNHEVTKDSDGLTRVNAPTQTKPGAQAGQDAQREEARRAASFDSVLWRERLQQKDLESRERDFDKLVAEAKNNDAARTELEGWAKDDSNPDLAWTSRLALREIGQRANESRGGLQRLGTPGFPRGLGADDFGDLRSRFDDLQQRFGGLDSMFDDLQQELDRLGVGAWPGMPRAGAVPPGASGQSQAQSYSLQMTPDGVKVEVSEDVNGKRETKTYTAKSLDELYEAHPELRDQFGARVHVFGNRASPFGNRRDDFFATPRGLGDPNSMRPARPLQGGLRTDILGVMIQKPSDDDVKTRKLDAGVGLKVESIEPGSLAEKIGVMKGDVLVELNGQSLKSAEDVRDTLAARHDDQDVNVTVVDDAGKRRSLTWRAKAGDDSNSNGSKSTTEPRHF